MGCQYTPVDSMATCVTFRAASHWRRRNTSAVMVLKLSRSLWRCPLASGVLAQAVTLLYVLRNRIYSKERPFFRISRSFLINTTDILSVYSEESYAHRVPRSVHRQCSSGPSMQTMDGRRDAQPGVKFSHTCFPNGSDRRWCLRGIQDHTGGPARSASIQPIFDVAPALLSFYPFSCAVVRRRRMTHWWRSRKRHLRPLAP